MKRSFLFDTAATENGGNTADLETTTAPQQPETAIAETEESEVDADPEEDAE